MIRSACSDKNHPLLKLLSQNSSLILYPEHPRVTGDWHVSLSFIFIQIQSISSHPMLLCCRNTLWERPRHRANGNKHTHTHGVYYIHVNNPSQPALTLCLPLSHPSTHENKYTRLRPSNTFDPEPRLTAKAGEVMNQGKDQRRAKGGWAKASIARWCLFVARQEKKEKRTERDQSGLFKKKIMVVFFLLNNNNKIRCILCYL